MWLLDAVSCPLSLLRSLLTVKISKTNRALPAVFALSHSAAHKARFNHFFPQVGLTFCLDKINYRSRLFLSFSLLAAFISRLPRVSMRVSALKNGPALLLLPPRSPGFSRRPAGWQFPHHIAWRLKGPHTHTLHVLPATLILLLGFSGGWDCLQPQVFSLWQFLPSRTSKQISSMSVKAVECYQTKRKCPRCVPGQNHTTLISAPQEPSVDAPSKVKSRLNLITDELTHPDVHWSTFILSSTLQSGAVRLWSPAENRGRQRKRDGNKTHSIHFCNRFHRF